MKRIIAFDIGANMAVAWNGPLDGFTVEHQKFESIREHRAGATLLWLTRQFRLIKFMEPKIDAVFYERPFARGDDATRCLWGLAGLIEATATNAGFPVVDMPPGTIKRWATGKGNATKEEMIGAAQIMGYDGTNEHEADCYLGLLYALENVNV